MIDMVAKYVPPVGALVRVNRQYSDLHDDYNVRPDDIGNRDIPYGTLATVIGHEPDYIGRHGIGLVKVMFEYGSTTLTGWTEIRNLTTIAR